MSRCRHNRSQGSTIRMYYTSTFEVKPGKPNALWYVECSECGKRTDLFLTWGEALERAILGWWKES